MDFFVKRTFYFLVGTLIHSLAAPVVQLDAYGRDSIRVRIAPSGGTIVNNPFSPYLTPPSFQQREERTSQESLISGNLQVTYDAVTGFITGTRVSDNAPLFSTSSLSFGPPAPGSRPGSVSASIVLNVAGGATNKLYGLGEHATGQLDMTGYSKLSQDSQYYGKSHGADILIPFYMAHPLGLGILWAATSYGAVSLNPEGHNWTAFATVNIDFWVTTTPAPAPSPQTTSSSGVGLFERSDPATSGPMAFMLNNYVDAVGHATPMPSYVAGFWQCKNRYRTQDQVLEVARGYRNRSLPLDIITIDYMHWRNWGDWSFNPDCFPDPQAMVQELNDMGVELAVTFWPYVCAGGSHTDNFNTSGFLVNGLGTNTPSPVESWACQMLLTDETNPAAREAIYSAFREGYGQYGIRTVWLDGSEPERNSYNFGLFSFAGGTDNEIGESWILQHVRALAEGFASDGYAPDEFFLLPRSAWSGTQRYSAGVWSGDITSEFSTLAQQIVIAQSMGLSGHCLWTNDGGGYANGNPDDPVFQQLIVRWLQASAFFPIMRLHGQRVGGPPDNSCGKTGGDNEIWNLAKDQEHYDALAATLQLRSDLRDYTLNINRISVNTGLPMVRAMVLAFPDDPACAAATPLIESQWMYGRDYLVAPVLSANATSRDIYLPNISSANETWIYLWNSSDFGSGGGMITLDVSKISDYGVFVRTPIIPPPKLLNVTSLWSTLRNDSVTCVSDLCYADQKPNGDYVTQYLEGLAFDSPGEGFVQINGTKYALVALTNFWSSLKNDNAVSIDGAGPDSSYDVFQPNGYVLAEEAPRSLPLLLFNKSFPESSHVDTAAFASSAGIAWAVNNGYKEIGKAGYVLQREGV